MHYTAAELAMLIRAERKRQGLTLAALAERVVSTGYTDRLTRQAVSAAEHYDPGDSMNALRVQLFEVLTGKQLLGPGWVEREE